MRGHHDMRRPFMDTKPFSIPEKFSFPVIKRVITNTPALTKQCYYTIRMDRTPPQNELFNLCMISEDKEAFLEIFETYSNRHSFMGPYMKEVPTILLSPIDQDWKISYLDLEVQQRNENNELKVSTYQYIPYYGNIDTNCVFILNKSTETNEEEKKKAIETYGKQKQNTNIYTISFLLGGSTLFQITSGTHSAMVFVFGCSIGIVYQLLLQYEIDRLGKNRMFVNSAVRLAIVSMLVITAMNNTYELLPADIWIGYSGFLMQKIALWVSFL